MAMSDERTRSVSSDWRFPHHTDGFPNVRLPHGCVRCSELTTTRRGTVESIKALARIVKNGDDWGMGYAGGKGRLWQNIIALMPPHDVYIETHLGGGAILRHKRPARASIGVDIDPRVIKVASGWQIANLVLKNTDAVAFLESYPFTGRELVYADPPYLAATKKHRRYYRFEYSDDDHGRLLKALLQLDCRVMISGYCSALYGRMLRGWAVKDLVNVTQAGRRCERVWANFEFSTKLHDYASIGGSFRERERIHRKATRWVHRLARLPELERRAMFAALLQSPDIEPDFADRLLAERARGRAT